MVEALIGAAEADAIRSAIGITFTNSYTRMSVTSGAEDAHGNAANTLGTPATGVACQFDPRGRILTNQGGTTYIERPTLGVQASDPLAPGDVVSDVRNAQNVVQAAGPLTVGRRLNADELGVTLFRVYELLGADEERS